MILKATTKVTPFLPGLYVYEPTVMKYSRKKWEKSREKKGRKKVTKKSRAKKSREKKKFHLKDVKKIKC